MSWDKINLVTQSDRKGLYDLYKCSNCGYKEKVYGLNRKIFCPKCQKKEIDIYGVWGSFIKNHYCNFCKEKLIICPKENHPSSKYWALQRTENEKLFICPNNCLEDGSFIGKRKKKRKKIRRKI